VRQGIQSKLDELNDLATPSLADKSLARDLTREFKLAATKATEAANDARKLDQQIARKSALINKLSVAAETSRPRTLFSKLRPKGRGPNLFICLFGTAALFCFGVDPAYAGFSTFVTPISTPPLTPPERLKKVEEAIIPFIKSIKPLTPLR